MIQKKKDNLNTINLVLTQAGLNRFLNVPTFKRLLYYSQLKELKVGNNKLTVNNTILGSINRLSDNEVFIR